MFNNRKKIRKLFPLGILVAISLVVYKVWISFSVFFYGDGVFFFKEALRDFVIPSTWGWAGGPLLWHYPFSLIYGIFGVLGFGTNIAEKFFIFWPIIFLAPLAGFFLVKKITNSNIGGFIGSLIFTYNTYFLSIDTQSHELLTLAFIFGAIAFLSFIYLLENKKRILIPVTTLLLFVVGFIDFRSLYVVVGIMGLYFIYNQIFLENNWRKSLRENLFLFLEVFVLLVLLNLYWLIPGVTTSSLASNEFLSRTLFGSNYYNLQSSLAFFYPYWTGKEPTWLYVQKIPMYFWLYPILAFSGFIVSRKNKRILFFGLLALIGIFLSKQEGAPFGFIYDFFFAHIPGFAAFREASKFDFITVISFAVLIGAFSEFAWNYFKDKRLKYLFVFLIALLPLWNTKPLITGEIKTMFVPITINPDFVRLKDFILKDPNYSRLMGISLNGKYIFSTYTHPEQDFLSSIFHFWGTDLVSYRAPDNNQAQAESSMKYLKTDEARRLLSASSVEYVPVFIEDQPSFQSIRRDLGKDRPYIESKMDKITYLKKIDIGMKDIILYKTSAYKPHLYLTKERESLKKDVSYQKVNFQMINPSEYHLSIKNLSKPVYLNFTELYSSEWEIHIGKFNWREVLFAKNYFLPDSIHSQNAVRFNQFYLDPRQVCKVYKVCKVESDGSYSFEATLYVKSQSYLYLGLILSGGVLIAVIGSIVYLWRKRSEK